MIAPLKVLRNGRVEITRRRRDHREAQRSQTPHPCKSGKDGAPGKIILRDFINATVGFTKLSDVTHRSAKSLMRMLGPRGNPQARNLFEIVAYLQHAEGVRFEVRSTRAALRTKKRPSLRETKRAAAVSR